MGSGDEAEAARTAALSRAAFTSQSGGTVLVVEGPDVGGSVDLGDAAVVVGSAPECDLVLTDETVSRRHLTFSREPELVLVRDQGSRNGSFVESARFEEIRIGYGAEIRLGRTLLKYVPREQGLELEPVAAEAFGALLGRSVKMRTLFRMLEEAAKHDSTVLLEGETGSGKELAAEELHAHSRRAAGPFVVFDCAAVPRELIASALFGHVKGSFTGAVGDRVGVFAQAHGGTIFLDEIGELPVDLQPTLLRVLEKRAVCRVGASTFDKVDVRIVAATHRNLREEIARGTFREDLYYRLSVLRVRLPPLRERREDIPLCARHFLRELAGSKQLELGEDDLAELGRRRWPGNVRELRNVIERACVLSGDGRLRIDEALADAPAESAERSPSSHPRADLPFKEAKQAFVRGYVGELVRRHGMNLSAAAREAGIDRKYLRELVRKYAGDELADGADD